MIVFSPAPLFFRVLRVLSLPTSRHPSSGWVLPVSTTRKKKTTKTATNYGSWPRQRPRRRVDLSNRERLDDDALAVSRSRGRSAPCPQRWVICSPVLLQLNSIGPSWRAIPVRGREQDSKRAYLCSLLLHQALKFKDNCRSVAT